MLTVLVAFLAIIVGVLFYRRNCKEGRELEVRRIQSHLAELSRQRDSMQRDELVPARITQRASYSEREP